jgi:hypothetical protein
MRSIDVHDLPEPVAKAIEGMVQTIRSQVSGGKNGVKKSKRRMALPKWKGQAIGALRRREMYEDVS